MEKHSVLFQTKQHVNSNHSRPTDCSIGGCEGYNRPPQEAFLSRWLPGCAGWGGNPSCPFFCHPVITQLLHGGQLTAVHPLICTETVPQLVLNVGGEGLEADFGGRKFMDVLNHFWKRKKKKKCVRLFQRSLDISWISWMKNWNLDWVTAASIVHGSIWIVVLHCSG